MVVRHFCEVVDARSLARRSGTLQDHCEIRDRNHRRQLLHESLETRCEDKVVLVEVGWFESANGDDAVFYLDEIIVRNSGL